MGAEQLPNEWVSTTLGEVLELKYGKSLPKRVRDEAGFPVYGSNGTVGKHSEPLVDTEGIIVGRKGSFGEVHHEVTSFFPIDTTYYVDEFYGQPSRYWFHQLKSLPLTKLNRSTAIPGLNREDAYAQPIGLPPLAEQKVIADILDTLLAQVESTKARLERIPDIIKRFRQSVLADAVSGKLTEIWRTNLTAYPDLPHDAEGLSSNEAVYSAAHALLPELPKEWVITPTSHFLEYVTSGSRGWAKYYSAEGALFLRMSNVRYDTTKLDFRDLQYVELPRNIEGKRSLVRKNDLIISITADVGRVARIDTDLGEAYINQHLALARPTKAIDAEFFAMCIAAQNVGVRQIQGLKRGATKAGLGLDDIRSLAIPRPSLAEQREIVLLVEQFLSSADAVEKQVKVALKNVASLTSSILAKAFQGELTIDWRNKNTAKISGENSARSLLQKIEAERSLTTNSKKSRGKSNRGQKMAKNPQDNLENIIALMPDERFSFDEIIEKVSGDYEEIKQQLFQLMSKDAPILRQVFDEIEQQMKFERVGK